MVNKTRHRLIHTVTLETNEDITKETEIKQSGETGTKEKNNRI